MSEMPKPTRIFLLRHGVVAPEARDHFNGLTDAPLDHQEGIAQIARVADYLTGVELDALYSSPLTRCQDTAGVLADKFSLTNQVVADLHEMNFGVLEGLNFGQVRESYPEQMAAWFQDLANFRIEGAETMAEVQERAWTALTGLTQDNPAANVAVAAHGAVNRLLIARALGMDIQYVLKLAQDYGCLNVLDFFPDGEVVVKGINIRPGEVWPPENED